MILEKTATTIRTDKLSICDKYIGVWNVGHLCADWKVVDNNGNISEEKDFSLSFWCIYIINVSDRVKIKFSIRKEDI